jgi:single-strand DNA-binding protein
MSRSLNKLTLIGNVGSEPEIRATSSGSRVAKVSLATSDYRGKELEPETNWHRLTFFGRLVDVVEKWVKKGDRLYVEGRVSYSQTEKDGQTRYWTDVIVNEMLMLGGAGGSGGGSFGGGGGGGFGGGSTGAESTTHQGGGTPPISEPDDDLPF